MFSRWWRIGGDRFADVDLFADDSNTVTLSQAISAASSEAPDADGSELFGTLRGTVVGLRYYTGVVRIIPGGSLTHSRSGHTSMLTSCVFTCTGESRGDGGFGARASEPVRPQRCDGD